MIQSNALQIPLKDESVQMCCTSPPYWGPALDFNPQYGYTCSTMRQKNGCFGKGYTYREPKVFWNKRWLEKEYRLEQKAATQIANEQDWNENTIYYWLKKHGIEIRAMAEIRKIKKWGLSGKVNGMYGRTGKTNPNWKGGVAPERQELYSSEEWSKAVSFVWKRDTAACQVCFVSGGRGKIQLHIHHIKSFALHSELRCNVKNLILVCKPCHNKLHSRG